MTIKELRTATGLSQQAFADLLKIPKRTIENWEGGKRHCPSYTEELIEHRLISLGMMNLQRRDTMNIIITEKWAITIIEKFAEAVKNTEGYEKIINGGDKQFFLDNYISDKIYDCISFDEEIEQFDSYKSETFDKEFQQLFDELRNKYIEDNDLTI